MLAVLPPLGNLNGHTNGTQQSVEMEALSIISDDDFVDFSSGTLLESIDFDELFRDNDVLPDLEMDSNLLAEFSLSSGDEYYSDINTTTTTTASIEKTTEEKGCRSFGLESIESGLVYGLDSEGCVTSQNDQEMMSKRDTDPSNKTEEKSISSSKKESDNKRHSKAHRSSSKPLGVSLNKTSKEGLQGKRKVKVDWTPELHKRFVQAVEQLGVDKAVPSRILEIMGIDCLTRHNIASHLQKYRSHRKHLLAREAEAASWSQRRHAFSPVAAGAVLGKRERGNPWLVPSIGFPPMAPPPQHIHVHSPNSKPFHVWGHPSVDQSSSLRPVWPKPLPHSPSSQPHPIWHNKPTMIPPSMRNGLCQGAPYFPTPLGTATRFPVQPIHGYPPHGMYKQVEPSGGFRVPVGQLRPNPLLDLHPSKESLDAAIGDVLSKPWLPLPIGLKPPELESVMGELQRNGVSNIPPSCA